MMIRHAFFRRPLLISLLAFSAAAAANAQTTKTPARPGTSHTKKAAAVSPGPDLEPKAIELLKATSARLAAARSLSFTAMEVFEQPSRHGHPLAYATQSAVTLRRNANVAAASANAAAANAAVATAGVVGMAYQMGAVYAALPAGCVSPSVQGKTYYLCGNTWFSPSFGANGVYYRVVAAP